LPREHQIILIAQGAWLARPVLNGCFSLEAYYTLVEWTNNFVVDKESSVSYKVLVSQLWSRLFIKKCEV